MEVIRFSGRQFALMLIGAITVTGHLLFVPIVFGIAGRDSWLSVLFTLVPGLLMIYILVKLSKNAPDKTLVEIFYSVFGKPVGKIIGFIYALYFLFPAIINLRSLMDFMVTATMPETPPLVFGICFLLLCSYGVATNLENLMRVNEWIIPILIFIGILASLLSIPDKNYQLLTPVMENGIRPIFKGSVILLGLLGELIVLNVISPFLNNQESLLKFSLAVVFFIILLFIGPMTGPIAIFGKELAANFVYPTFNQIAYLKIAFIENLQPLAMLLWLLGSLGKITLFYYASVLCTGQVFGVNNNPKIILISGVLILILAQTLFQSTMELRNFVKNYYSYASIFAGVIFPFIILIAFKIKKIYN